MRILALQLVPSVRKKLVPRFDPQLGVLLALLRQRGHELSLLGLSKPDVAALKSALARALPQFVYADISPVCAETARVLLQHIQQREFLPVVAGGAFASADPAACLSLPGVQAAALGEPDASLLTYFERYSDPAVGQVVQGLWLRHERGLDRPRLPALVEDLDSLPFAERVLLNAAAQVQATGELEISIGRGCPQRCAYCLNPHVARLYAEREQWTRRRSPEHILAEVEQLRARYGELRLLRFLDHSFAQDAAWLEEFLAHYERACDLPFRCHLRANALGAWDAARLQRAGCRLADVEVISGSDFLRNDIFQMDLSDPQIEATFEALRSAGIHSRGIVYLGAPYESDASLEKTAALLRRIRPDAVDVRPYYPFPATAAAELARANGWLHARGEEQYHADRPGSDLPACRAELVAGFIRRLRREFPVAAGEPWWRKWTPNWRRRA